MMSKSFIKEIINGCDPLIWMGNIGMRRVSFFLRAINTVHGNHHHHGNNKIKKIIEKKIKNLN